MWPSFTRCWPRSTERWERKSELTISRSPVVTLGVGVPNAGHKGVSLTVQAGHAVRTVTHTHHRPTTGPSLPTKSGSYAERLSPHPPRTSAAHRRGARASPGLKASNTKEPPPGRTHASMLPLSNTVSGQLCPRLQRGQTRCAAGHPNPAEVQAQLSGPGAARATWA